MRRTGGRASAPPSAGPPALPGPRASLNELVYAELRRQILWGEITAGEVLSVRRLSARFQVSPMPVRDAIRRLAVEELVEVTPRSATRVSPISPETVREIAEVRSGLEALGARLALPQLTGADVARLRELLRAMQAAATRNEPEAWHDANAEFHRVVIHRSGNRLLTRMTEGLWDRSIRHFSGRVLSQASFRRRREREHQAILQAIVRRDAEALEQAWRQHVYQSGLETVEYLRALAVAPPPFPAARPPAPGERAAGPALGRPPGAASAPAVTRLRPGR
jgi:DNA-binding GntR family transcriptional regulator